MGYALNSKQKIIFFGIILSTSLILNASSVHADTVGGYTFSTDVVYYGEISSIRVSLGAFSGIYRISRTYPVNTDHVANLDNFVFDDTYPEWDNYILKLLDSIYIKLQIRVDPTAGGSETLGDLNIPIEDLIPDVNVTITSIVLDPSGLILRNPAAPQTTGSVTWTVYGTPGTVPIYPSGYTPPSTTTTINPPDTSQSSTSDKTPIPFYPVMSSMIGFVILRIKRKY